MLVVDTDDRRDFRNDVDWQKLFDFLLCVQTVIGHFETARNGESKREANSQAYAAELEPIREVGLLGEAWRIHNPEPFALLE
jgi:hypothetical protein